MSDDRRLTDALTRLRLAVTAGALALALAGGLPAAASAAQAPLVEVSVVTRSGQLLGPLQVRAREVVTKVGGKRCAVAAGTPLAALLGLRAKPAAKVPAPRFTDYSGCGLRPSSSGRLYLSGLGADRATGAAGWVYDLNGKRGTNGAAERSGPFGRGRLKDGQRLVWSWCHADTDPDGSCGPALRLTVPRTADPAAPLSVRVAERSGPEGEEREVLSRAGTVVIVATTLAGAELARATTDGQGLASLSVPPATRGRIRVTATQGTAFAPAGQLVVLAG